MANEFKEWVGDTDILVDPKAAATIAVMGDPDVPPAAPDPDALYSVTATFGPEVPRHWLQVCGGSGTGFHAVGSSFAVVADIPAGEAFDVWTGDVDMLAATGQAATTVTAMHAHNASVTATLKNKPLHHLTVVNGQGDGDYWENYPAPISADPPPPKKVFDRWTGSAMVADASSSNTTVKVPQGGTTVTATYKPIDGKKYKLTMRRGTAATSDGGMFLSGSVVAITADAPSEGGSFKYWETSAYLVDALDPTTLLTMPARDCVCSAVFSDYKLTVLNGVDRGTGTDNDGLYNENDRVGIEAAPSDLTDRAFSYWNCEIIDKGALVDAYKKKTTVVMPARDCAFQAIYAPCFNLVIVDRFEGGEGSGCHPKDVKVTVRAGGKTDGVCIRFAGWDTDPLWRANLESPSITPTVFTMPGSAALLRAEYEYYLTAVEPVTESGWHKQGATITLTAPAVNSDNKAFNLFKISYGGSTNDANGSAVAATGSVPAHYKVVMQTPDTCCTVSAEYMTTPVKLTVATYMSSYDVELGLQESVDVENTTRPPGKVFSQWVLTSSDDAELPEGVLVIADAKAKATQVSVALDVSGVKATLTAEYIDAPLCKLTVTNNKILAANAPAPVDVVVDSLVEVAAPRTNVLPEQVFKGWTPVEGVAAVLEEATQLTVPLTDDAKYTLTANFADPTPHKLTLVKGVVQTKSEDGVVYRDNSVCGDGGVFTGGKEVSITANLACEPNDNLAELLHFYRWEGAAVDDRYAQSTTLIMPNEDTTVTATFYYGAMSRLIVEGGSVDEKDGDPPESRVLFPQDEIVPFTRDEPPEGKVFVRWLTEPKWITTKTGDMTYRLMMPANDLRVYPLYRKAGPSILTVTNGTGGGEHLEGDYVVIKANVSPLGLAFLEWVGDLTGTDSFGEGMELVADPSLEQTTFRMPGYDCAIEATYGNKRHLEVLSGITTGDYAQGSVQPIKADPAPVGQVFVRWIDADTNFQLTVGSGTGDGYFPAGALTPITADPAPAGMVFDKWAPGSSLYKLTIAGGPGATGEGSYAPGASVTATPGTLPVAAGVPPILCDHWEIGGVPIVGTMLDDGTITFPMPAQDTTATVVWGGGGGKNVLTLVGDATVTPTADGSLYAAGDVLTIKATGAAPKVFKEWTCDGGTVNDPKATTTTFKMPAKAATVTAVYDDTPLYKLTCSDMGGGSYKAGANVTLTAFGYPGTSYMAVPGAPPLLPFVKWEATAGVISSPTNMRTSYTMPSADATVTAVRRAAPTFKFKCVNCYPIGLSSDKGVYTVTGTTAFTLKSSVIPNTSRVIVYNWDYRNTLDGTGPVNRYPTHEATLATGPSADIPGMTFYCGIAN